MKPHRLIRSLILLTAVILTGMLALVTSQTTRAQEFLNPGDLRLESLSGEAPLRVYTFMANAGDTITIEATGAGFFPALTLLDVSGQVLGTNSDDALSQANFDSRITRRMENAGAYSVLVGGANGGIGAFQISLHIQPLILPALLVREQPVVVNVPQGQPRFAYAIEADPFIELRVIVRNLTPEFDFLAVLYDETGRIHGSVQGYLPEVQFVLPPRNTQPLTTYQLHLSSALALEGGDLCVGVTAGLTISCQPNAGQGQPQQPPPQQTQQQPPPQVFPTATPQAPQQTPPPVVPSSTPFVPAVPITPAWTVVPVTPAPTGIFIPTTRPAETATPVIIIPQVTLDILPTLPQSTIPHDFPDPLPTATPTFQIQIPGGVIQPFFPTSTPNFQLPGS